MKTKLFSNLYRSLGLSLGVLLAVLGATSAPTAQAAITGDAPYHWYGNLTSWSTPRSFYEVPVGGVLTSTTLDSGRFAVPNAGQSGGSNIRFYSYPTRVDGSRIDASPFKATATPRIDIQ